MGIRRLVSRLRKRRAHVFRVLGLLERDLLEDQMRRADAAKQRAMDQILSGTIEFEDPTDLDMDDGQATKSAVS